PPERARAGLVPPQAVVVRRERSDAKEGDPRLRPRSPARRAGGLPRRPPGARGAPEGLVPDPRAPRGEGSRVPRRECRDGGEARGRARRRRRDVPRERTSRRGRPRASPRRRSGRPLRGAVRLPPGGSGMIQVLVILASAAYAVALARFHVFPRYDCIVF